MEIEVNLFATLRQGRFKKKRLHLPEDGSLGQLLDQLGIPHKGTGILLVNGRAATPNTRLGENDFVSIFPPIAGG